MEKTISREDFEKIWTVFKINGRSLEDALNVGGITVEPVPVLPGVTGGDWRCEKCGHTWIIIAGPLEAPVVGTAQTEADAKVMTGSSKLVELVVGLFRKCCAEDGNHYLWSAEAGNILEQLLEMGFDGSEFREVR